MIALMRLGGYDSATASTSLQAFEAQARYIAELLALRKEDSLFEVGCGAGATLLALRPYVARIAGLDYAQPLVRIARAALDCPDITCAEASALETTPRFDVVLSVGAFLYFPDEAYVRRVLDRMAGKARRAIAVLDVNDAARRDLAARLRREAGGGNPGPDQLFIEREVFAELAARRGLSLRIDESRAAGSINRHYRYNVLLEEARPD